MAENVLPKGVVANGEICIICEAYLGVSGAGADFQSFVCGCCRGML